VPPVLTHSHQRPPDGAEHDLADSVLALAKRKNLTIVTAESCTCGMLAHMLSQAEGAGDHLHGGFLTYTKTAKQAVLGVPAALLASKGAVCEEVARAMAMGALERSPADLSVAVTGVAGPAEDEDGNPVGLVHLAAARRGGAVLHVRKNYGNPGRDEILRLAIADALRLVRRVAEQ
jgi:nicotinamide-nucleotide amidase